MYQHVAHYKRQDIQTATPGKLVVMLYDGALKHLDLAKSAYEQNDYESKVHAIGKCRAIVLELLGALDFDKGGDIAKNLQSVYLYTLGRLRDADMKKDTQALLETRHILADLREAWVTILKKGEPQQMLSQTG